MEVLKGRKVFAEIMEGDEIVDFKSWELPFADGGQMLPPKSNQLSSEGKWYEEQ